MKCRALKTATFCIVGSMFMMAILSGMGSAQTVSSSNATQENQGDLLRDDKAAFARLKSLVDSQLSSAEQRQFNSSFAGLGLRNGEPGSSCSELHFMAKVNKVPEGRGDDKLDAVLEICAASTFWAGHTTLIFFLLSSVLSSEEFEARGESIMGDLAKYQNSMADDTLLSDSTRLPMCPVIWATYFLAKYGRIGDCQGNGKSEYLSDAVAWLALNMNDNVRKMLPDAKFSVSTNETEFMEFIEEMQKYFTRMIFDRVVLHEIGHIVLGHHRSQATSGKKGYDQLEHAADKFATNKKPEDQMEQLLKYFVNVGLATHLVIHRGFSKEHRLEKSRVSDSYLVCESLKALTSIDIDPAMKAHALQAEKKLSCP